MHYRAVFCHESQMRTNVCGAVCSWPSPFLLYTPGYIKFSAHCDSLKFSGLIFAFFPLAVLVRRSTVMLLVHMKKKWTCWIIKRHFLKLTIFVVVSKKLSWIIKFEMDFFFRYRRPLFAGSVMTSSSDRVEKFQKYGVHFTVKNVFSLPFSVLSLSR